MYEQTKKQKNPALALVLTLLSVQRRLFVLSVRLVSLNIESACFEDTLEVQTSQEAFDAEMLGKKAWIQFVKCVLINCFKTAEATLVPGTFFFLRASSRSSTTQTPAASLRRRCTRPLCPAVKALKTRCFQMRAPAVFEVCTCHVEGMDLGNGPATVWALSCRAEEPTERMGKKNGTQDSHRPQNGRRGRGRCVPPPRVNLALSSLSRHLVTVGWR